MRVSILSAVNSEILPCGTSWSPGPMCMEVCNRSSRLRYEMFCRSKLWHAEMGEDLGREHLRRIPTQAHILNCGDHSYFERLLCLCHLKAYKWLVFQSLWTHSSLGPSLLMCVTLYPSLPPLTSGWFLYQKEESMCPSASEFLQSLSPTESMRNLGCHVHVLVEHLVFWICSTTLSAHRVHVSRLNRGRRASQTLDQGC